jgi:hypothetical protein
MKLSRIEADTMKRQLKENPREYALRILDDNANCREGSLVSAMNDHDIFSKKGFWDYYNALVTLTAEQKKGTPLRRKEAQAVYTSYSMILQLFIYHLSPKDACRIRRLPLKKLHLYMERLHLAGQGFFWAHVFGEEVFDQELKSRGFSFEAG